MSSSASSSDVDHPNVKLMDTSSVDGSINGSVTDSYFMEEEEEDDEVEESDSDIDSDDDVSDGEHSKADLHSDAIFASPSATASDNPSGNQTSIFGTIKSGLAQAKASFKSDLNISKSSIYKIKDPSLVAIGKKIRQLEEQCKSDAEHASKLWNKNSRGHLESQIKELAEKQKQIQKQMQKHVEVNVTSGNGNISPTLHASLTEEKDDFLEKASVLENELKSITDELEAMKRHVYFPNSKLVLGQNGVYAALDDFWIEHASGHFELSAIPSRHAPSISVALTGSRNENHKAQHARHAGNKENNNRKGHQKRKQARNAASEDSESSNTMKTNSKSDMKSDMKSKSKFEHEGISIRIKLDNFKLAGDRGKGVPKISLESTKVTVCVKVHMTIKFNVKANKWTTSPKDFRIELLSFKGPYGINKSIVSATLAVVVPTLRSEILQLLPLEVGYLLRTLPSPLSINGDFYVSGTKLSDLTSPLFVLDRLTALAPRIDSNMFNDAQSYHSMSTAGKADMNDPSQKKSRGKSKKKMKFSSEQLEMFKWMQRSMKQSKILKTVEDILNYRKLVVDHPAEWDLILECWEQASEVYCNLLHKAKRQYAEAVVSTAPAGGSVGVEADPSESTNSSPIMSGINSSEPSTGTNTGPSPVPGRGLGKRRSSLSNFFASAAATTSSMFSGTTSSTPQSKHGAGSVVVSPTIPALDAPSPSPPPPNSNTKLKDPCNPNHITDPEYVSISLADFLESTNAIMRKPIKVSFTLNSFEYQVSFNQLVRYSYQYLKRIAEEFAVKHRGGSLSKISSIIQSVTQGGPSNSEMGSTSGNVECDGKHVENTNAQVLLMMSQIEKTYLEGMQLIGLLSRNLDFVQLNLQSSLRSGRIRGHYHVAVTDLLLQAPLNMTVYLNKGTTSGHDSLVPSVVRFLPQDNGEVHVDVSHVCIVPQSRRVVTNEKVNDGLGASDTVSLYSSSSGMFEGCIQSNSNSPAPLMDAEHHSMLVVQTASPHIAVVIDAPVKQLKPGAELLTVAIGPRDHDEWKPFNVHLTGSESGATTDWGLDDMEEELRFLKRNHSDSDSDRETDAPSPCPIEVDNEEAIPPGCPILIKTDKYIKFLTQMNKIHATVHLHHVFRFIAAHFEDIPTLQEYMNSLTEEIVELSPTVNNSSAAPNIKKMWNPKRLSVVQMITEKAAKYMLKDGLVQIDMNMKGKIVALDNEIMLSVETLPLASRIDLNSSSGQKQGVSPTEGYLPSSHASNAPPTPASVRLDGDHVPSMDVQLAINLNDVLEDSLSIDLAMKYALELSSEVEKIITGV